MVFCDQGYPETVGGPVQKIDLESFVFSTSSVISYYHVNLVGSKHTLPWGKSAKGGILGELLINKLCVVYFIFHAGAGANCPLPILSVINWFVKCERMPTFYFRSGRK